jgi:uncharacterized protein (DUF779 family)
MSRHDPKLFESREPPDLRVPHFTASRRALYELHLVRRSQGRQVVVLASACARVSVAHVHSEADYAPRDGEVRLGTLAHCPVYGTRDCIEMCPHAGLVLDVHVATDGRGTPVFFTRPESAAERQQRVFCKQARIG